jgi:hypothetical protein
MITHRGTLPQNIPTSCLCKSCAFTSRCGFEGAKIRAQDTPTCDDDCTHGRWYVSSDDKKLRCDRICIHTIDNFICPFEQHDTAIRNATLDVIQDHNDGRLEGLESLMATPSEERCESAQDVYLKEAYFELTLIKHVIESLRSNP